jgi:hypothetical protein
MAAYVSPLLIVLLIAAVVVGVFVSGRRRDRCLKDFNGDPVTIEVGDSEAIDGRLFVAATGIELTYPEPRRDDRGRVETSYILYKREFGGLRAVARYFDELDEERRARRDLDLKRTHPPSASRRWARRTRNFIATVRDALLEFGALLLGRVRPAAMGAPGLAARDKYAAQLRAQVSEALANAYEPLLERHIGRRVVVEVIDETDEEEWVGVLEEYSIDFIEIVDVEHCGPGGVGPRRADLILPRRCAIVRHGGE